MGLVDQRGRSRILGVETSSRISPTVSVHAWGQFGRVGAQAATQAVGLSFARRSLGSHVSIGPQCVMSLPIAIKNSACRTYGLVRRRGRFLRFRGWCGHRGEARQSFDHQCDGAVDAGMRAKRQHTAPRNRHSILFPQRCPAPLYHLRSGLAGRRFVLADAVLRAPQEKCNAAQPRGRLLPSRMERRVASVLLVLRGAEQTDRAAGEPGCHGASNSQPGAPTALCSFLSCSTPHTGPSAVLLPGSPGGQCCVDVFASRGPRAWSATEPDGTARSVTRAFRGGGCRRG